MSLVPFWGLKVVVVLEGQKALRFHQKDHHLCFEDEWKSWNGMRVRNN